MNQKSVIINNRNVLFNFTFYSNTRIKEILLEIGLIEEMRTTWGNKKVPHTFFHNFPYLQKCDIICLTPFYWQTLHFAIS